MSGRYNHRGESRPPPERRRRLNEDGLGENRYNGRDADAGRQLPGHPGSRADLLHDDLMNRDAQDTITGGRNTIARANMMYEESNRENQALREDNDVLRECMGATMNGGASATASPTWLLRVARDHLSSWEQGERN